MYQELTEAEFIEKFSEKAYREIMDSCIDLMKKDPKFYNDNKYYHSISVFPWTDHGYKNLIIECDCEKEFQLLDGENCKGSVKGFGISKYAITDEDMPDEFLDRLNELSQMTGQSLEEAKHENI